LNQAKAIFRKEQTRGDPGAQSHGAVKTAGRSAEENTSNTTPIYGMRLGFFLLPFALLGCFPSNSRLNITGKQLFNLGKRATLSSNVTIAIK
jgi:hypothetical protein